MKCKFCEKSFRDVDVYVRHLEKKHDDMIPPDMLPDQFYYYLKTGKTNGNCVICKQPTTWNMKTHKYNRFCQNPKCKDTYKEQFRNRMITKYGKVTLLNDPEQQKKMLAHRRISGVYRWSSNPEITFTYTGTYELSFLKFLDHILDFDPADILMPSPHTYTYIYEGASHFYIPDIFIPTLNLEIEIKDNSTTHPKFLSVDKVKERLKDEVMKTNANNFNYLKINDKHNEIFIRYLMIAKQKFANNDTSPIIMI